MKIIAIIKKEYTQIVKKKSFLISTILTPVLMGAMLFVPVLLTKVGREAKIIQIADYSGSVAEELLGDQRSQRAGTDLKLEFTLIRPDPEQGRLLLEFDSQRPPSKDQGPRFSSRLQGIDDFTGSQPDEKEGTKLKLISEYRRKIIGKQADGLLLIPENLKNSRRVYFFALNVSDFALNDYLTSAVQKILSRQILTARGYDIQVVEEAIRDISMATFKVKKEGITKSTSGMDYMMSIFMLTILFMVIMLYGQLIMRGIIEEKNNRIVEVLISSTNSRTLFYGKIIGVGLAGFTQISIWVILAALAFSQSSLKIGEVMSGFFTVELGIYFVIFFLIGYYMYSIFFSIVGAAVNTDQEAQQYAGPIFTLLFIPFLIGIMVTQNPNSTVVLIASMFPLFTPTLMFMRISVAVPPLSQILISMGLSILTTLFLAWLGAKIFRTGILLYGKKPSIKEIARWIRYP